MKVVGKSYNLLFGESQMDTGGVGGAECVRYFSSIYVPCILRKNSDESGVLPFFPGNKKVATIIPLKLSLPARIRIPLTPC